MEKKFMDEAVALSRIHMENGAGGPFGCVIVKEGVIIGRGWNSVLINNDPTAHAEICAIRQACAYLNHTQLEGCEVYTSCEPCPMCMGAIYWARPSRVFYANTRADAAAIAFDDSFIYEELKLDMEDRKIKMVRMDNTEALKVFEIWTKRAGRTYY